MSKPDLSNLPLDLAKILERARGPIGDIARALNEHCAGEPQVGCLIFVETNGQLAVLDYNVEEDTTPQLHDIADTMRAVQAEKHGEPDSSIQIDISKGAH